MSKASLLSIALLPLALAACSMSPPPGSPTAPNGDLPLPQGGSFNTLKLQGQQIDDSYEPSDATTPETIKIEGTATYRGIATFGQKNPDPAVLDPDAVGRVVMKTDIKTGAITGSIYDIRDSSNTAIDGTLTIDGDITEKYLIAADVEGQLTQGNETANILATYDGKFYGEDAEAIMGYYTGMIDNPFFLTGPLVGFIGAEK